MNGIFICTRCEWCFVCSLSWITYFFVFAIFISTKMANCYKLPYDDMTSSHVGWSTINRSWTLIALREEPKRKLHWSYVPSFSFVRPKFLTIGIRPLYFWNTIVPKHEYKKFVINEDLYKNVYFPYTIDYFGYYLLLLSFLLMQIGFSNVGLVSGLGTRSRLRFMLLLQFYELSILRLTIVPFYFNTIYPFEINI